ncbi:pimeloyl-ACP methyl esterase BioG family protein [Campylobacter sp.]|uniref:pimeloyl-ACP methyl esterase BioG family protein n=1 Tax=Campylobacter sp. TaxID=205 RepID=UPI0026DB54BE|nr:pimeloyl-ACP methyl esterase BioG family protein [Campylobacter sp.]MDO4674205.1 DUF452 family protein [Campylobacter sp.]
MKKIFLHQNADSGDLIVVFGGFASHPSHFSHLKSQKNVLLFFDYEDFSLEFDFKAFENITLIAFSMGVCVASKMMRSLPLGAKIALNGTNQPIDRNLGIHPGIFRKNLENFSLKAFKKSLLAEREKLAQDFEFKDEAGLKKELGNLLDFCQKERHLAFEWDRVYASAHDEIFPTKAIKKSFGAPIFLNEPHFAFFAFDFWEEL